MRPTTRPRSVALGVGCSTDASVEEVEALVRSALAELGLDLASVCAIATIDRRLGHPAIVHLAQIAGAARLGYSAERLATVTDAPTPSTDLLDRVGTPSVCEAAAILASSNGQLVVPKRKSAHATVAVAQLPPVVAGGGERPLVGSDLDRAYPDRERHR